MKNRLLFIPAGVIVLVLLITGSLCDLTIAKALFHPDNGFSHFMAGFAMMPIGVILGFVLGNLFKMALKREYKKTWQNVILYVVSFAGALIGIYLVGSQVTSYHAYNLSKWYSFLFGAVAIIPGYLCGYFFYEKMNHKRLIRTYLLVVLTVILLMGVIEITKILLPRLRYTSVAMLGDDSLFRPWYLTDFSLNKQWVLDHHLVDMEEIESFPSGHSNASLATAFALMFVPKLFPRFKGKEVYFFYIGFTYFLLVAFSRIFIGAHYLSDTMFAGTLAMLVYFISNEIYLRKIL